MAAGGLKQAEAVLQAFAQGLAQGQPLRCAGHDAALEPGRVVDVAGLQGDVEIPDHAQGVALALQFGQVALQAGQPFELVGVFLGAERGAVGHIEIQHPHTIDQGTDDALLLPQALGVVVAGQQGRKADLHVLQGHAADQGDAVVGLLAADLGPIAQGLEGFMGKAAVFHLGFLQAEQLGLVLLQPGRHLLEAAAHRIDIPAGNPHRSGRDSNRVHLAFW